MPRETYTTKIGHCLYDLTDWRLPHERPLWHQVQRPCENLSKVSIKSTSPVLYVVRKSGGSASIKSSARQNAGSNTTTTSQPKRDVPGSIRMIPKEKARTHWSQSLYQQNYNSMTTRCDTCGVLFKRKSISQCFCSPTCRERLYNDGKVRRGFAALLAEL